MKNLLLPILFLLSQFLVAQYDIVLSDTKSPQGFKIVDNKAYIADRASEKLFVYDLLDSEDTGTEIMSGLENAFTVVSYGSTIYLSDFQGIHSYDTSDAIPNQELFLDDPGVNGIIIQDNYLYFIHFHELTTSGPIGISRINLDNDVVEVEEVFYDGLLNGETLAINGNKLYVSYWQQYAIVEVDISESEPTFTTILNLDHQPQFTWLEGDILYWSEILGDRIGKVDLSDPDKTIEYLEDIDRPTGIVVYNDALYFSENGTGTLYKYDIVSNTYEEAYNFSNPAYPNPAVNFINIQDDQIGENISIHDLKGNLIFQKLSNSESKIDISSLAKGSYFMKIGNTRSQTIIKM